MNMEILVQNFHVDDIPAEALRKKHNLAAQL